VDPEEQARFIFRVPDAREGREILQAALKWERRDRQSSLLDSCKTMLGICLEKVENLYFPGNGTQEPEPVQVEKEGPLLAESTLGVLQPFLTALYLWAQELGALTEDERKNSE
jgi:hypothetical protein